MLLIAGTIEIDPEQRDQAIEASIVMMAASRAEPGCIEYTFSASFDQPHVFHLFEQWSDQAALDAHFKSPHMATFQAAIKGLVRGMTITKYNAQTIEEPLA